MELEVGMVIELENNEAYLISNHFTYEENEYVSMVSVNEPVHVKFAQVMRSEDGSQVGVEPITDEETVNFFSQYVVNDFFAQVEEDEEDLDEEDELDEEYDEEYDYEDDELDEEYDEEVAEESDGDVEG